MSRHLAKLPEWTVFYLSLPYLLFFYGWFKLLYAIVLIGGILWCVTRYWSDLRSRPVIQTPGRHALVLLLFIGFLWTLGSGFGFFQGGLSDSFKHHSFLYALMIYEWPVLLPEGVALINYNAFYLPPSLVGKLTGWKGANAALFFWMLIGVILTLLWFVHYVGTNRKSILLRVLVLILFGGLDVIGHWIFKGSLSFHFMMETWNPWAPYSSLSSSLYWVPHHALPAFLVTSLMLHEILDRKTPRDMVFIWSLACFWSPFVLVGLVPLVLYGFYRNGIKRLSSLSTAFALVLVLGVASYYLSVFDTPIRGWIPIADVPEALLALVLEVGGVATVLWLLRSQLRNPDLFYLTLAVLALIPIYQMGHYNDWGSRVSIPWLFILCLFCCKWIGQWGNQPERRVSYALLVLVLFGSVGTLVTLRKTISELKYSYFAENELLPTLKVNHGDQYRGNPESFFFRYLARD